MMRILRLAIFIVAVFCGSSRPVAANMADDIWDALEALSGPGSFEGRESVPVSGLCFGRKDLPQAGNPAPLFGRPRDLKRKYPCWFFDYRRLVSHTNDRFPTRVQVKIFEAGATWELQPFMELGVGAGFMRFNTAGLIRNRLTITPLRFVFMPIRAFPKFQNSRRARFLKYYVRETWMPQTLTGADFAAKDTGFKVRGDVLTSAGFLIDVFELIGK
jgi:hypothetical protein